MHHEENKPFTNSTNHNFMSCIHNNSLTGQILVCFPSQ